MVEARKLLSVRGGKAFLEDGIEVIENLSGVLRIIVMIGDGRAGKSFLANKIIGQEVFAHAPTPEAVTAGIDLYSVPYRDGHLLLWDCEGGNNALARTHQMVNVLGMVAASKIVYVVAGMASDAAFETLERNFASRELVMQGGSIEDQEFLFLVNKNNLTYEAHHFENMLEDRTGNAISALYPRSQRKFLTLGFEGSPNFCNELEAVHQAVEKTNPRSLAGLSMSGSQLGTLIRLVVRDFDAHGKVEMPVMARVVIYDHFLAPLVRDELNVFMVSLPSDREAYLADPDQYDTRRERLDQFGSKTAHISAVYGDFREEATDELDCALATVWKAFLRRNEELGEMVVRAWTEQQAPFSHIKTIRRFNERGEEQVRYADVHNVQTRAGTLRANGFREYTDWVTVSCEERDERDKRERRITIIVDAEATSARWISAIWRAADNFFSGNVEDRQAPSKTIHDAAYSGDIEKIKSLLHKGAQADEPAKLTLMTPLHLSARAGHHGIVRFLLEKEVSINARDAWDGTPLHSACAEGHIGIVRDLLESRDILMRPRNKFEQTPLDLAVKYNRGNVVQLLRGALSHGQEQY